ncbi:MAG: hypothetical protein ACYTGH_04775 [Planctomycetota bacterium]|jgi:hypothetical protein
MTTNWTFYSDSGVPAILVVLGLVVTGGLLFRWLRAEVKNRQQRVAKALPFTLLPLCLLLAWLVYNPVFIRTTTWQEPKRTVAILDHSRSMDLALAPDSASTGLDLLALLQGSKLTGRMRTAAELAEALATTNRALARHRAAHEDLASHQAQGIPYGPTQKEALATYRTWRQENLAKVQGTLTAFQATQSQSPKEEAQATAPLATLLDSLATALGQVPEDLSQPATQAKLGELQAIATDLAAPLAKAQTLLDTTWLAKEGAVYRSALESLRQSTRYDLVKALAQSLPEGSTDMVESKAKGETDLYALCEEIMQGETAESLGHLVLFSDGAHNGETKGTILQRLKEEGTGFTTVALPEASSTGLDLALLDWNLRPLVRAGKETELTAVVRVPLDKAPNAHLRLTLGDQLLGEHSIGPAKSGRQQLQLSYKAPDEGRHVLRLTIECKDDRVPENNTTHFIQETVNKISPLLLIGDTPTWDTAYLGRAAARIGVELDQVYCAGEKPKRGSFSRSVPKSESQWKRKGGVILMGKPFPSMSEKDGAAIHAVVHDAGKTLLVFGSESKGTIDALAPNFKWKGTSAAAEGTLQVRPETGHLPLLQVGLDPAVSKRRLAALPTPQGCRTVPAQDLVLLETSKGEPLVSIGFYGQGKVILWGLTGLHHLRGFGHTKTVDRLLTNLMAELSQPLLPRESKAPIALYPPLPAAGRQARLIQCGELTNPVTLDGKPVTFSTRGGTPSLSWPATKGTHTLSAGSWEETFQVVENPGLELLNPALNSATLKAMAAEGGGTFITAAEARNHLSLLTPGEEVRKTATIYRPGRHWLILPLLLALFTLHWIFRKLAGLVL